MGFVAGVGAWAPGFAALGAYTLRARHGADARAVSRYAPAPLQAGAHTPPVRHRPRREAQSATSLVHPNIVSIYDVGEEGDSVYYIVMEYVEGQTLKQYIQQHSPIPVAKALSIMEQLTSAIIHAHQNHIIHRDIKPQNILMDPEWQCKNYRFRYCNGFKCDKYYTNQFCSRFSPLFIT